MIVVGFFEAWRWRDAKYSYSQAGEDLIVDFIATAMQVADVTYLDIGAHHPVQFSNTYLFYKRGHRGVLIEPDPDLNATIKRVRPLDICIDAGVGLKAVTASKFFVMSTRTLNTFSKSEAKRYEAMGTHRIERVIDVPMITLDQILSDWFPKQEPTLVSIDVEGLDFEVLSSLDFKKHRPAIICIETLRYSESREETKDERIAEAMKNNGYFAFADTYINTIFVDTARWKAGGKKYLAAPMIGDTSSNSKT
jgi:FkbM family methyltransferase